MNKYFIGIDIGSTCAKTVVMNHEKEILHRFLKPTGWSSVDTANQIQELLREKGILPEESVVVATGYGRVSVPYAAKCVTEITCHAKGACYIHKNENMLLIDIGGQDTKIIRIENDMVTDSKTLFYEQTNGDAFVIGCNVSDIFPDVTVSITSGGETVDFSPYISLKDGSVQVGARGLNITRISTAP